MSKNICPVNSTYQIGEEVGEIVSGNVIVLILRDSSDVSSSKTTSPELANHLPMLVSTHVPQVVRSDMKYKSLFKS